MTKKINKHKAKLNIVKGGNFMILNIGIKIEMDVTYMNYKILGAKLFCWLHHMTRETAA